MEAVRERRRLPDEPPVGVLLDVDAEYRRKAAGQVLPRVSRRRRTRGYGTRPRVLHTRRGGWEFTVLYSNTDLARRLRRTRDWVVLRFRRDPEPAAWRTVVTETRGPLEGRRVVRGRECEAA